MFDELRFPTSLGSDNHSGIHPRVLEAVAAANRGHAHAYGHDELCKLTEAEFARVFGDRVQVEYVFTGTAANVLSLAPLMRSYQSVICSEHAHLHVDECAAPEKFWGGKLLTVPSSDGRITPEAAEPFLSRMGDQHYAQPRAVSLTQPTEFGVCYQIDELKKWREWTRKRNLMLHLDGARLVNAAAFLGASLKQITADIGADVVSFGGTKNGLMGAEAVLLFHDEAKSEFKFYRKQAMQLSSKTRFLAAQFYAYLHDDLWLEIARHVTKTAQELAARLKEDFPEVRLAFPVESNALFVELPKDWIKPLREKFFFYLWPGSPRLARWMISFDWTDEKTNRLFHTLQEVQKCFPTK